MESIRICSLFEMENIPQGSDKLKIDEKDILFFRNELKCFDFYQNIDKGRVSWSLIFFKGEEYETKYNISFFETQFSKLITKEQYEDKKKSLSQKLPFATLVYCDIDGLKEENLIKNSIRLKGGKSSIRREDFLDFRNAKIFIEPKNIMYVNEVGYNADQNFQRFILLYALSQAYIKVINDLSENLRGISLTTSQDRMRALVKNVALFNAKYFFIKPISDGSVELNAYWSKIIEKYDLLNRNNELINQIKFLHEIIEIENISEQEKIRDLNRKTDEFRVYLLALLGVAATLASMPGLVEIFILKLNSMFTYVLISYAILIFGITIISYALSKLIFKK